MQRVVSTATNSRRENVQFDWAANHHSRTRELSAYVPAQLIGAFIGVAIAHVMFSEPLFTWSTHARAGFPQAFSELIATFGLLAVIWGCARLRADAVPFAVGAYISAAYWFMASTSFANPAVTLARMATNRFSGIRPQDVPAFLLAQAIGASAATILFRWLVPTVPQSTEATFVPQEHPHPSSRAV
jgi:glycerol uptake facilitator-like aquaporin